MHSFFLSVWEEARGVEMGRGLHSKRIHILKGLFLREEFGILCCLATPGLRKDIQRFLREI